MDKQWLGSVMPYVMILNVRVMKKAKKNKFKFSPQQLRKLTMQQWKQLKQEKEKAGSRIRLNSEQEKEVIRRAVSTCQRTINEIKNS